MSQPGRAGGLSDREAARPQLVDEFLPKVEEWMDHSHEKIRADKLHEKLLALGYARFGAHDPPGGRADSSGVQGRAGAGAPGVGDRAGDVVAVRTRTVTTPATRRTTPS